MAGSVIGYLLLDEPTPKDELTFTMFVSVLAISVIVGVVAYWRFGRG